MKRKKRKSKYLNLRKLIFIALFLILIFTIVKLVFNKDNLIEKNYKKYFTKNHNAIIFKYNKNLYFQKHIKEKKLKILNEDKWILRNLNIKDNEYYIISKLDKYFRKNNLDINLLSIYIEDNNSKIIELNTNIKTKYKINNFMNFVSALNILDKIDINIDEEIKLIESDFINKGSYYSRNYIGKNIAIKNLLESLYNINDTVSFNALNRYFNSKGENIESNLRHILNKDDIGVFTPVDTVVALKILKQSKQILNPTIVNLLKEDQSLFLNSIYTDLNNVNMLNNGEKIKYDFGIVNSHNLYYYSIYTEKLSKKNIIDIADIINRTIDELKVQEKTG